MAYCFNPFKVKTGITGEEIPVPCGKCANCYATRISQWSVRLMNELKVSSSGYFITLTYDTKYVPISDNGFLNLCKADLQKFFKRLRKAEKQTGIKYYAVGEYGGKKGRPHYHIILFNSTISSIQNCWPYGQVNYGRGEPLNEAAVGYVLKYISKGKWRPKHERDDRQKEFSLMSKGLGKSYLTPQMVAWHHADMLNRMYVNLPDGKKAPMGRYYRERIYTDYQRREIIEHTVAEMEKRLNREVEILGISPDEYFHNMRQGMIAAQKNLDYQIQKRNKNEIF